jgi:hypothetical protein
MKPSSRADVLREPHPDQERRRDPNVEPVWQGPCGDAETPPMNDPGLSVLDGRPLETFADGAGI